MSLAKRNRRIRPCRIRKNEPIQPGKPGTRQPQATNDVGRHPAWGGCGFVCNIRYFPCNPLSGNPLQTRKFAKSPLSVSQSSQTTYSPSPGGGSYRRTNQPTINRQPPITLAKAHPGGGVASFVIFAIFVVTHSPAIHYKHENSQKAALPCHKVSNHLSTQPWWQAPAVDPNRTICIADTMFNRIDMVDDMLGDARTTYGPGGRVL
jgi:hypothetical protein